MSFSEHKESISISNEHGTVVVGFCSNKKCNHPLFHTDQQINFTGGININSSVVGVAKRKYSNKAGGPRPFIGGKFKPDMKPNW